MTGPGPPFHRAARPADSFERLTEGTCGGLLQGLLQGSRPKISGLLRARGPLRSEDRRSEPGPTIGSQGVGLAAPRAPVTIGEPGGRELLGAPAAARWFQLTTTTTTMMTMTTMTMTSQAPTSVMPVVFLAHGAPPLLDDAGWIGELAAWGRALPRPRAIVVASAHWEQRPLAIGATRPVPLIYDFYGFPERFYRLTYPAPGAPEVAHRIRELLAAARIECVDAPDRGLDHGSYLPLMCMFPAADVPVLQISLPSQAPDELFALGRALAPLRREGVLVIGSGFLTHNLGALALRETPGWARAFDAWSADVIARLDVDALLDYRRRAPGVHEALPTHEHFAPAIVAVGAAGDSPATFPITGFWFGGALTRRSVQFG